jgi:hypothetical protein
VTPPKGSAILTVALGTACLAKSTASARTQSASSTPQPSPQMQILVRATGGKWSVSYKFEPDETNPKGSTGEGEANWSRRIDPHGRRTFSYSARGGFPLCPSLVG